MLLALKLEQMVPRATKTVELMIFGFGRCGDFGGIGGGIGDDELYAFIKGHKDWGAVDAKGFVVGFMLLPQPFSDQAELGTESADSVIKVCSKDIVVGGGCVGRGSGRARGRQFSVCRSEHIAEEGQALSDTRTAVVVELSQGIILLLRCCAKLQVSSRGSRTTLLERQPPGDRRKLCVSGLHRQSIRRDSLLRGESHA